MKTINIFTSIISLVLLGAAVLCTGCTSEQRYSESVGTFYTLKEAYEAGFLTRDDLMSIAYYP